MHIFLIDPTQVTHMNCLKIGYILHGKAYNYEIERILGQGAFGITYLAKIKLAGALGTLDSSIQVAIKEFFMKEINGREDATVTCSNRNGLYDKYRVKFAREAQNLSKLSHPNIVKVLESFEANNTVYYAMEYIDGGSLNDRIEQQNGLPEAEALDYVRQIGSALSYMHAHKMLHLDLKPANIMLRNGVGILIDFGLSKQYDENGLPESSTTIGGGTPGYAPIEQMRYQEGKDLPVTMDVYALGATLFKMLTGKRPPEASDLLNDGFPAGELQQRGVSESTIAALAKAMAPIKAQRYQSVNEFVQLFGGYTINHSNDENTTFEEGVPVANNIAPVINQPQIRQDAAVSTKIKQPKSHYMRVLWCLGYGTLTIGVLFGVISLRLIIKYDSCNYLEDMSALIEHANRYSVRLNGKTGFVNLLGKEVIPCKYDLAWEFSEGLAKVRLNGKYGFIDKTGKEVVPCIYDETNVEFSEGLMGVQLNGKWGFVDKAGNEVIPCIYDNVDGTIINGVLTYMAYPSFGEGLANVRLNGKWGYIDKTGMEVIPFIYQYARGFQEGVAIVYIYGVPLNGIATHKCGFINKNGHEVIPCIYDDAKPFSNGLANVLLNGEWFYIDKNGNRVD